MEPPNPDATERMLSELRSSFLSPPDIADRLPVLLDALRDCSFGAPIGEGHALCPDPVALGAMLGELKGPVAAAESPGDPWRAAALRRDEVRNSSVLAWFLDPKGGHGLGDTPLRALLAKIGRRIPFPDAPSRSCVVMVENCPDGSRASRVDITVDDPGQFFLGIEVKIDAPEQPGQLERYCRIAEVRACDGRPWAVAFLTPSGRTPATAGDAENVVPMSWTDVAAALRTAAAAARRDPRKAVGFHLAKSFATHIDRF